MYVYTVYILAHSRKTSDLNSILMMKEMSSTLFALLEGTFHLSLRKQYILNYQFPLNTIKQLILFWCFVLK